VAAAERRDTIWTVFWIFATMLGGIAFIVLHSYEWRGLIVHEHVKLFKNDWGVPLFGATFFGITGLHMLHVTSGVIYLGVVAFNVLIRGPYNLIIIVRITGYNTQACYGTGY